MTEPNLPAGVEARLDAGIQTANDPLGGNSESWYVMTQAAAREV